MEKEKKSRSCRLSDGLNRAQHVHQAASLSRAIPAQIDRVFHQQLLDFLRPSDKFGSHRQESRDNTGNVGRGLAGSAALDVIGARIAVKARLGLIDSQVWPG